MGSQFVEEPKQGPPAYMVSFGDMMTLILTFFILLVSMSNEQMPGLMAKGVGSFIVALKSHGMSGVLSDSEKQEVFNDFRRRFILPEEEDPERRDTHTQASAKELVRSKALEALRPHRAIEQPAIATFDLRSALLGTTSRNYLDRLAETLRPQGGQILILQGHALEESDGAAHVDTWLAYRRAAVVREYLIEEHGFLPRRVEARAWLMEIEKPNAGTRSVDARLITPSRKSQRPEKSDG